SRDSALGVATDRDGNGYVVGETNGDLSGSFGLILSGSTYAFVRKYAPDGTALWTDQFGAGGTVSAAAVAVDAGGNVYVAGAAAGALPGQTAAGVTDAFVRKYATDGAPLWTRQFGTSRSDAAVAVAADEGGAFVAGSTLGSLGPPAAGGLDAFVRRYAA